MAGTGGNAVKGGLAGNGAGAGPGAVAGTDADPGPGAVAGTGADAGAASPATIDALESLAIGSVAVTTLALAQAGVELTFAQWRALMVVAEDEEGATISEIAAAIGSATSPASRLVTRMRDRGLVRTRKDARDHRATRVHLSERGWAVRDRVVARRRELLGSALRQLPPLPPPVAQVLGQLGQAMRTTP